MKTAKERWIEKYGKHPKTVAFLAANPPPEGWEGTPEEYAYTEMPAPPAWLADMGDELRVRVARAVKHVRKGIERSRIEPRPEPAPTPTPGPTPAPVPPEPPRKPLNPVAGLAQSVLGVCRKK